MKKYKGFKTIIILLLMIFVCMGSSMRLHATDISDDNTTTEAGSDTVGEDIDMEGKTEPDVESYIGADDIKDDESVSDEPTKINTKLYIDNQNIYEGMNKSYSEGYIPTIENGSVLVVIPLKANNIIKDSTITASVDLGTGETIPFVQKNYEKDFGIGTFFVNGGASQSESYLVRFNLELKQERYNGSYPVNINISAYAEDGTEINQTFITYVTITDGKSLTPEPEEIVDEEDAPVFTPKILVSSYSFSNSEIKQGDTVTAEVVFINTSKTDSVKNMTVALSTGEKLELVSKTDSIYIESVGANETFTVSYDFKVDMSAAEGQYNMTFSLDYADYEGRTYTSTSNIKINVGQLMKVQFDNLVIPETVEVGQTVEGTTQVMNMGKGKIYNVRAELSVDGLKTDKTLFLGNVDSGSALSGSMEITAIGRSGNSYYGETEGVLTFYYEDESGNEFNQSVDVKTNIVAPTYSEMNVEAKDEAGQWWIIMAVIVSIIIIMCIVIAFRNVKKKRDEY